MLQSKRFLLLSLVFCWMFIGQSCTPKKAIPLPKPPTPTVLIDANFTSQSLNERLLVCTKLTAKDLTKKDLNTWIAKNTVKVSQKKEAIFLGSYRQYPEAWFYVQLINSDSSSRQLVVDEFIHVRCDAFNVYTFKNGEVKKWGSVNRLTSFSDYPIPFMTYAIPFTINPKDTLNLLVQTKRQFGRMEVNLGIAGYQNYLGENIPIFLSKLFQIFIFLVCICTMFVLGSIFRYQSMTYLGYFLVSLLLINLTTWGFTDAIIDFKGIGLSAYNQATFAVFVSNILLHPFINEWMKVVPKNEKIFKRISYFIMSINLLAACCFFVPVGIFPIIDAYFFLPQLMLILALLSIIWMFFCAIIALIRTNIYYMLLGFGLAFLPFLMKQLSGLFTKSSAFLSQGHNPTFALVPIGLSLISIYLLREKLVTRKNLEQSLILQKGTLEEIRKAEVEAIGRNLHDNLGNLLVTVLGYLNLKNPNTTLIKNLLNESINEVRFLSHNLVKQDNLPITDNIEMLISRSNDASPIQFYFNDLADRRLNKIEKIRQQNLYLIVQEILTNIIKHSKATEAHIQIFDNDGLFQITIEDDGIGMANRGSSDGIGLQNIYKRAELSAFKITLDSNPRGTDFIIELHENKNDNRR